LRQQFECLDSERSPIEIKSTEVAMSIVGSFVGAKIGAVVGTVFLGPVGTVIGAKVGALVGSGGNPLALVGVDGMDGLADLGLGGGIVPEGGGIDPTSTKPWG